MRPAVDYAAPAYSTARPPSDELVAAFEPLPQVLRDEADAMDQMVGSADRIAQKLGSRPVNFAYPYGDPGSAGPRDFALARKAGFKTAVTTRKGMLFPGHAEHLTALPRVSLNGDYQSLTYTALYLSGAPFALWNKFQQVNAA